MDQTLQQLIQDAGSTTDTDQLIECVRRFELAVIRTGLTADEQTVSQWISFLETVSWDAVSNPELHLRVLIRCGRYLDKLGYWEHAGSLFSHAVASVPENSAPVNVYRLLAIALMENGELKRRKGLLQKAEQDQEHALELAVELGMERERADALNNLGIIFVESGQTAKALSLFHSALEIAESINAQRLIGHINNNLGVVHCMSGQFHAALTCFQHARIARETLDDQNGIAEVLHNLAMASRDLKQWDQAFEYAQQALAIVEQTTNRGLEANIRLTIAELTFRKCDYIYARSLTEQVLNKQKKLGDAPGMADSRRLLGEIYLKLNQWDKAGSNLGRAMAAFEQLQIPLGIAECAQALAKYHQSRNELEQAEQLSRKARDIYTSLGVPSVAD